jgi:hypothetical protein
MNSIDENYAPAVLPPAVLNIFVLPQTVLLFSQLRVKIFNRLNSKKHLNLPKSIYTNNSTKSPVSILIDLTRSPPSVCFYMVEMK